MKSLFAALVGITFALAAPRADALCVVRSGAVLRSAAAADATPSWKVPKYMPLQSTGQKKGSWIEVVDVDGQRHWVSSRDVSSRMICIVVKTKRARVRKGPGGKFEMSSLGVADRYSTFLDRGGEDGWTQVEDEAGQRGWIHLDQTWKPRRKVRISFDP